MTNLGLRFGAFIAPHHPIGENPMLQLRRDLDLVEQLDKLGYDEFWCGEHHSTGWEVISSPEMFLAAAGERTRVFEFDDPDSRIDYPVWSADGRWVYFDHADYQGGDIWLLEGLD